MRDVSVATARGQARQVAPRKDAPIVVYCASVTCPNSDEVAKLLGDVGYTDVRVYKEGKADWEAAAFHSSAELSPLLAADLARTVGDRHALVIGRADLVARALDLARLELRPARTGDAEVRDARQALRARIVLTAVLADAGRWLRPARRWLGR